MRKSYWIWLIVFYGIVVGAVITAGGNIGWYLNIPAAVMVLGPALVLSLGSFGFGEIADAFKAAFRESSDRVTLENALLFFEGLKKYFLASGVIGGFAGAIAMLIGSSDKVAVAFGAGLIVVTILYGVMAYTSVAVPFATAVRKRLNELAATGE